jgi:hypothetical protein
VPPSDIGRQGKRGHEEVLPVIISRPVLCALVLLLSSLVLPSFAGRLNGWEGAMHIRLHTPFFGIEGDLSHYGLGADYTVPRTTAFICGPRITFGALRSKVVAHALVGGEHPANSGGSTPISSTALAYA